MIGAIVRQCREDAARSPRPIPLRGRAPALLALAVISSAATHGAEADPPAPEFPPGEVVPRVVCREAADHSYALFLPSSYDVSRRWPALLVMDPRGRAVPALEVFQNAAEDAGWMVISSYDTRSDTGREVNDAALRALLPEIEARFSLDTERLYLAGMSGTARTSWMAAFALRGHVAGILAFAAGLPSGMTLEEEVPFAVVGGAGSLDFNHEEVRGLEEHLEGMRAPQRFLWYDGPHGWPPPEAAARGVQWLEVRAMATGKRTRDDGFLRRYLETNLREAELLEEKGRRYEAWRRYRETAADLAPFLDVSRPAGTAQVLEGSREVQAERERRSRNGARERENSARLRRTLELYRGPGEPPSLGWSLRDLRVKALQKEVERAADPPSALSARRMLEEIFLFTSYYEPRAFLGGGDASRALAVLRIADAIHPGHPRVCWERARAEAARGGQREALEALRCVRDAGALDADAVQTDPFLAPLWNTEELRRMLGGEPAAGEAPSSD